MSSPSFAAAAAARSLLLSTLARRPGPPAPPAIRSLSTALLGRTTSPLAPTRLPSAAAILTPFHPLAPRPLVHNFTQHRHAVANFRPKKLKHKKAHKGFWPTHTGGSLRGTTVYYGDYGLQALEGGRLSDKQLDSARVAIRRVLKQEKGSRFFLRCFPDRPVTSKGAETRMGKGKGAVDYFATFVAAGRVIVEVKGVRKELAEKAMRIAAAGFGIRTRFIVADKENRMPPRVLPAFVRERLARQEFAEFDAAQARKAAPTSGRTGLRRAKAVGTTTKEKIVEPSKI
ncbi:ribosomal protein L10e/L16 [Geranomyces variabilis]|nr:ribosomal protein L10e/L16 [Geranomyces variabilis]KAJ3142355.1 mitochondrial ribosomal large subunit component [Geranomyces variabilis]